MSSERERDEPDENAGDEREPAAQDAAPIVPGVLDEPEDLERDHRQHARHQVQNEAAEKTEEQELARRLRLSSRG